MGNTMDRSEIIKWLLTVALTAVFLLIPETGFYNEQVKLFFAITVLALALAAFELIPNLMIAILMPSLWILFEVAPIGTVMSVWASATPLFLIGVFLLAATLEDCGLLKRIAFHIMLLAKGNFFLTLVCIMLTGIVLNILTSGMGHLITAAIATGLYLSLKEQDPKMGVCLAVAVMLGGCQAHSFTYQASACAVLLPLASDFVAPDAITPLSVTLHCFPIFIISLITMFIVYKWYKPEKGLDDVSYFKNELDKMGPMTKSERNNLIMAVILLVLIFTVDITKLNINLIFAVVPWLVYMPFMKGATVNTLKKINYDMTFFCLSFMSIGTVANSLNLGEYIAAACNYLLNGNGSPFLILAVVFAIVFVLNFLMTPLAIWALVTVPICTIAVNAGLNPIPFLYALNSCSEAIIFPYEYVPYLIVFSFGLISMKDFIKTNILRSVLFFGGYLIIVIPYWMLLGLL